MSEKDTRSEEVLAHCSGDTVPHDGEGMVIRVSQSTVVVVCSRVFSQGTESLGFAMTLKVPVLVS